MARLPNLPTPLAKVINFQGGLDQVTPTMRANPGMLRETKNFEIDINGGYKTIEGYERFDGRAAPSAAVYFTLEVTVTGSFEVDDEVTGVTSGATGTVIAVTDDYLVLTKVTGTFTSGETLNVSGSPEGTADQDSIAGGAPTPLLDATYTNLAADDYRDDIAAVPGEGDVLGVFKYNGTVYAFRNNVGSTQAVMHSSSASGWQEVDLGLELEFTGGGTYEVLEGDTITGATSSATAVVTRVVLESGDWSTGDAAGRFIFASQTGTFQSENLDVGANANVATIAGDSDAITLDDSGRFKTVIYNFSGAAGNARVYGCDGVNRGWEFDGTTFVPINTGMSATTVGDRPQFVWAHKFHLFFSFNSSVQHSALGDPYSWTPVLGAAELAVGDNVTGFSTEMGSEAGAALGIFSSNTIHLLYGSSSSDWQLLRYREEIGAFEHSIQTIGNTVMVDAQGFTSFRSTLNYGNFVGSTLSELVQSFMNEHIGGVTDSCIVRGKGQYRVFFSDGQALYATFKANKLIGIMVVELTDEVTCMVSVEGSGASDEIYFGSDNGFVYQLDKGTSFDGGTIESYALFHYAHFNSPRLLKRWLSLSLEMEGEAYAEFSVGYEIGYSSPYIVQPTYQTSNENFQEARWDTFTWDSFYWDGVSISPKNFKLAGSTENIGLVVLVDSDMFRPLRFSSAVFRYLPRRYLR